MMEWLKALPGAIYDQAVEVIARYPRAAFWVLVGSLGFGGIGWVL
jgi:hypothetical protein